MKKYLFSSLITALFFNSFILNVKAEQIVTMTGDPWPPYVIGEAGKEASKGTGVELIQTIFTHIDNADVRFPLLPWKRALNEVREGRMDGIAILLKTPEREKYMAYTDALYSSYELAWYSSQRFTNGFDWQSINDFKPHIIGIVNGYSYPEVIRESINQKQLTIVQATSTEQLFAMLAGGRIDIALANSEVGYSLAEKYSKHHRVLHANKPTSENLYYIGLSKKASAINLIPQINNAIQKLKDEGEIKRIMQIK